MQQLTCPNCGEHIPAEQINIQHMTAVCPACSTVFQFNPPEDKNKRRKVKQPQQLTRTETEGHLGLSFRTNWRLEQNVNFRSSAISSVMFTFVTVMIANEALIDGQLAFIALGFVFFTAFFYYWLALTVFNKTHIDVTGDHIQVSRQPIPNPLAQPHEVSLYGIANIRYEETPISIREGYDLPRYHVWAEMIDGGRRVIVSDVVEDYAVYITQQLHAYLDLDAPADVSRLTDAGVEDTQQVESSSLTDEQTDSRRS